MFKRQTKMVLAGVAAAALLAGCSSSAPSSEAGEGSSDKPVTLTYASFGGTFEEGQVKAWQEPFTTEHPNVSFANTSPADTAMIKAQVEAGQVQWDIADINPFFAADYCDELVEPLALTGVDEGQFNPALIGDCYFGAYQFALIVSYNADTWPDPATAPKTVADFFDAERFPGQRGVANDPTNGMIEYALLADGVKPDDLYPLDIDRSLNKWETIRNDTTFAANNGAMLQLATSGQLDMMMLVSARTKSTLDEGGNFVPIWDKTMSTFNTLVVPKGAPNKDLAMEYISFVLQPEPNAAFADYAGLTPTNLESTLVRDENGAKVDAFDESVNEGELLTIDADWWGKNVTTVADAVNTWLNR